MLEKKEKTEVRIRVIGESGVGKSKWISSLFQKGVREELKRITAENKGGQTKIGVHYVLQPPDSIKTDSIKPII